jgi:hypothetical protein
MADRIPMQLRTVVAIVVGFTLIGWAVGDVLPWAQRAALVFGVVLIAYGMATSRPVTPP